jgi:hypothetical protein
MNESDRVEGSVTVSQFEDDYEGKEALQIRSLFEVWPSVVAVLVEDNAGMVYEVTRDKP